MSPVAGRRTRPPAEAPLGEAAGSADRGGTAPAIRPGEDGCHPAASLHLFVRSLAFRQVAGLVFVPLPHRPNPRPPKPSEEPEKGTAARSRAAPALRSRGPAAPPRPTPAPGKMEALPGGTHLAPCPGPGGRRRSAARLGQRLPPGPVARGEAPRGPSSALPSIPHSSPPSLPARPTEGPPSGRRPPPPTGGETPPLSRQHGRPAGEGTGDPLPPFTALETHFRPSPTPFPLPLALFRPCLTPCLSTSLPPFPDATSATALRSLPPLPYAISGAPLRSLPPFS